MTKLTFNIATKTVSESDNFLRCLWSQLRSEFSNYGWNYFGSRHENVIELGLISLGLKEPVISSYDYKVKGCINNFYFDLMSNDNMLEIKEKLTRCISNAKKFENFIKHGKFRVPIESYYDLPSFEGSSFNIIQSGNSTNLEINISYYDKTDVQQEVSIKASDLNKLLTIVFSLPIFLGNEDTEKIPTNGHNYDNELEIIDNLLSLDIYSTKKYNKIIDAATSFFNASKIIYNNRRVLVSHISNISDNEITIYQPAIHKDIIDNYKKVKIDIELAVVSLVSGLEVLASMDKEENTICPECNQRVYSISKKVYNLSRQYGTEDISKSIKSAYNIRSQIVHAGVLLEKKEAMGRVVNPRMDLSQNGKLIQIVTHLPEQLAEDVRCIYLNYIKELVVISEK